MLEDKVQDPPLLLGKHLGLHHLQQLEYHLSPKPEITQDHLQDQSY